MTPALIHGSRMMVVVAYEGEGGGRGGEKEEKKMKKTEKLQAITAAPIRESKHQNVANGRPPNRRPAPECRSERH